MNNEHPATFTERICRRMSASNVGLRLVSTPTGYDYAWSNGCVGTTTAATKPVALYLACVMVDMGAWR